MKVNTGKFVGHILAFIVEAIWAVTYVATELLIKSGFTELQILVMRFVLALLVLYIINPKIYKPQSLKQELSFFLLSVFGMTCYYLFENLAIGKTDGTNVSIIISFAPILTLIGSVLLRKKDKVTFFEVFGFILAITGVIMVVFNGTVVLSFNMLGYILAFGAALSWAIYSVMLEGYLQKYDSIIITRRMLIYSLLLLVPAMLAKDGVPSLPLVFTPGALLSLSLLGIFGGSLCYIWWNSAVKRIGVVTTTNYIYLSPFITMIFAYFVADTRITPMGALGAVLIIGGVVLSDLKPAKAKE